LRTTHDEKKYILQVLTSPRIKDVVNRIKDVSGVSVFVHIVLASDVPSEADLSENLPDQGNRGQADNA
jgi:hypothetical protein